MIIKEKMGKAKQLKPYKYEIGDTYTVKGSCGDGNTYKICDRRISYNEEHKLQYKEYLCECNRCHSKYWHTEKYIIASVNNKHLTGFGCKDCGNTSGAFRTYENTIDKTDPWAIELFKDKSEASKYTRNSHKKTWFVCPYCGNDKYMEVREMIKNHRVSCQYCGDGYSYPNKFAFALCSRLPVEDLKREYIDSWTENLRYDISFYYFGKHYLIEMDGAFHYYEKKYSKNLDVVKIRDERKDVLASNNNCILFRIDSRESTCEYLKKKILNSGIADLFDLSKIDWLEIDKECITALMVDVCLFYNETNKTAREIANKYSLSESTDIRYLKRGSDIGITDYRTVHEIKQENLKKVIKLKKDNPKLSHKEIAEMLGINISSVDNYLKEASRNGLLDIPTDARDIRGLEIQDIIRNNPELNKTELCKLANCCLATLNNHIKKMSTCA